MKMNPTAFREILLQIEAVPAGDAVCRFNIETLNEMEVMEHVQLLLDAGFIEGTVMRTTMGKPVKFVVRRMTLAGHQFLDKARNETFWNKALETAKEKGLSTSLSILTTLLEGIVKQHAGIA
jgi:Hypothetical protein (DUF2513)